jgi:endonuclease/exonuclease/phosphatase family metal-dependent hydrolase
MRSALRVLLTTLFSLGLLFASVPAQADTPDPVNWPKPRFITYNVCGASCDIYAGSKTEWRTKIVSAMDYWDADLVMLQEMCYGQWTMLRDSLENRSSGAAYDSVWGATLTSTDGCAKWGSDKRYGLATFAKGGPGTINNGSRTVHPLTEPTAAEDRILLCARANVAGRMFVRACNTHIDYRGENPTEQIKDVARITRSYSNLGDPVVLAGDFNQLPKDPDLAPLYNHNGGYGIFQEVDESDKSQFTGTDCPQSQDRCRSGEATAERASGCSPHASPEGKIDYIFLSYASFKSVRGDAAACTLGMSDHHLLRGAAAWES